MIVIADKWGVELDQDLTRWALENVKEKRQLRPETDILVFIRLSIN